MSDHLTTLIPQDPSFVPRRAAQAAALALLRKLVPRAEDIVSDVDEAVTFRDCGGNFEAVACPRCRRPIEIETWQGWMSKQYTKKGGFRLRPIIAPCCGGSATLNDLEYTGPQGFSRYYLSMRNPGRALARASVGKLEQVLGCQLRLIRQRV